MLWRTFGAMGADRKSPNHRDWALDVVAFLLWIGVFIGGAAVVLVLVVITFTGLSADDVSSAVAAELDPPYTIEMENGTRLVVERDGTSTLTSASGEELQQGITDTSVDTAVPIRDGELHRVASTLLLIPWFGLVWTAGFLLWRVVQSARHGDPFTPLNVTRLRRVAMCVAGIPLISAIATLALRPQLIDDVNASLVASTNWEFYLTVAVVVVAIAEVLRRGIHLRYLADHTI